MSKIRVGRIAFINVAPIYYALENGRLNHPFELVADIPAHLNDLMRDGLLEISACSCLEYARRFRQYYLAKDLCIASNGPVMSVLLLAKRPLSELNGAEILLSGQSHTSVLLTRLLLEERYHVQATYTNGSVSQALTDGHEPLACLTIGDEALKLRNHPSYPYVFDLALEWREWTNLPFVFAVWVISRKACALGLIQEDPGLYLRQSLDYGLAHLDEVIASVAKKTPLSPAELDIYYQEALNFRLTHDQLQGLELFYQKITQHGWLQELPEIHFFDPKMK